MAPDSLADSPEITLAAELIRRPSISPEDQGCMDIISRRLAGLDFQQERLPFGVVENLWARHGQARPILCFAGHTDVVPSGSLAQWHADPFVPTIDSGVLYGRGAADMKGSLAAMIVAAERFIARCPNHRGSLAFLLTSDEEGPSVDGTRRVVEVLERRHEKIDWCLVGEATSAQVLGDMIKVGRRGSLSGRLTVHGTQGHVAYPHLADNPIHALAPVLAELTSRRWDQGNDYFQPTTFQVSNIDAGTGVPNVIPGEVKLRFNLRFCTEQTVEKLQRTIVDILERHGVEFTIEWFVAGLPFLTAAGELSSAVQAAIGEVTGLTPELSTTGGTSDGRFIAPTGAQVVEFGLLSATIHKANECTRLKDLLQLARIYERIMDRLLDT